MAHDLTIGPPTEEVARRVLDPACAKRSRLRRRSAMVVVAVLTGAATLGFAEYATDKAPPRFDSVEVTRADVTATVAATGTVEAKSQVEVGAELSGLIVDVNVGFNSHVTKGQLLAMFDPSEYKAQIVQSEAELRAAAANQFAAAATVKEADGKLSRARELAHLGWVGSQATDTAQATYDRALADFNAAQARVSLAAAKRNVSETQLSKTKILAPMDGTVLDRLIEPGQVVVAALQTPHLFTIVGNLEEMTVTAAVSEADVAAVRPGQEVRFSVAAYPQRKFVGSVTQIRDSPHSVDGVVTYRVVVSVRNPDLLLKPGMTATIDIVTTRDKAALVVPNAALRFTPPGQPPFRAEPTLDGARRGEVWIGEAGGHFKSVPVVLGATDGRVTEIVGGDLAEGQPVLTGLRQEPVS